MAEQWDDESIADLISDAMADANDLDVTIGDLAKAAVKALRKKGLLTTDAADLVAALEWMLAQGERCHWFADRGDEEVVDFARAAIAKADTNNSETR